MLDPMQPVVDIDDLLRQADAGHPAGPEQIKEYLQEHPELAAQAGDLTYHAQEKLIASICGDDKNAAICLREKVGQLRAELADETDSTVVRLAADRVATNWLHVHFLDFVCGSSEERGGGSSAGFARRRESAQRLYLQSLRMHATLKKSTYRVRSKVSNGAESGAE